MLIDIGGGTADFICYSGGDIVASGCIPAGGNTINKDIVELSEQRVTNKAAEVLKCTEGNAFGDVKDRSMAQYKSELGMHDVSIPRGELNRIIRDRLADILLRVRDSIPPEVMKRSGMTVYLSGGTSLMRGLDSLAQFIFRVPVKQPMPPERGLGTPTWRILATVRPSGLFVLRSAMMMKPCAMPHPACLNAFSTSSEDAVEQASPLTNCTVMLPYQTIPQKRTA